MSIKEQITKIKDYADLAWASYAMLHYIEEKEKFDVKDDEWMVRHNRKPPARWIYADGIKRGYELEKDIETLGRKQGQPTAYALAIEASFSEKREIRLDEKEKPKKIDNKIQNFIYRSEDNPSIENQKIKVSTTKEKMIKDETSHYLSTRTKAFTSRYELLHHQKNTFSGFSATLFYDTQKDKYIVSFRGTETEANDILQDFILAFGGNLQENALAQFLLDISHILNEANSEKIIFVGHSLGGFLAMTATQFCDTIDRTLDTDFNKIKFTPSKVYTFNAPAIRGKENMFMKFVANLFENNIAEEILHPEKITHIYDDGGVEIIASAQYGSKNRLALYTGEDAHSIIPITQTLYFYEYLLQNQNNHSLFFKDSLQASCDALGIFVKTIYQNMFDQIKQKEQKNNEEELSQSPYYYIVSCFSSAMATSISNQALEMKIKSQIPNPIIAILDKALFEGTLITKEEKQDIKKIQIFEAIAYLQEHNILISVMQDSTIKAISSKSPLAYLLSIYEFLPFICTNKDNNPLIQNIQDFRSLTQKVTSTKISVFSNTISEKMIEAYKNQTLLYSIEIACRIFSEEKHKQEQKERRVEIIAKDSSVKIEKISRYSRKILEEIGIKSENYRIVITDVARTPKDQARQMYRLIEKEGIMRAKAIIYKEEVHSVIKLYADCKSKGESKLVIQREMEKEIKKLIKLGYFQHCQDFDLKNTFDISVRNLDNHENFLKFSKDYEKSNKSFKIIDESRNQDRCFHIEISQPTNKEQ